MEAHFSSWNHTDRGRFEHSARLTLTTRVWFRCHVQGSVPSTAKRRFLIDYQLDTDPSLLGRDRKVFIVVRAHLNEQHNFMHDLESIFGV